MERTAVAHPRAQPTRQSEWLRSVLAHHHCPDPRADNEIIVLATGIDQYLQEVFHHLAHPNQNDTVCAEDFRALCAALGLPGAERGQKAPEPGGPGDPEQNEEFRDTCFALPEQLSFKDFHARLCGVFRVRSARSGTGECRWRLPVSDETELVERQIRLRWPRVRRRKCVSFDLTRDQPGPKTRPMKTRTTEEPDEAAALRELVEDLRSALQGSDARCLALEVALRRGRDHASPTSSTVAVQQNPGPRDGPEGRLVGPQTVETRREQKRWDIRDPVLRELKLIRSSRDGQLEEAIRFNQRLEEELQWAYQEVRKLQGVEFSLRKENTQIRKRAEEAREALRLGLQRVRLIQEQAQSVPHLQSRITQLEEELLRCRSCCSCVTDSAAPLDPSEDPCSKTAEELEQDAECLQRAVEGRAASDEEEDDREMKRLVSHVCGKSKAQTAEEPDVRATQTTPPSLTLICRTKDAAAGGPATAGLDPTRRQLSVGGGRRQDTGDKMRLQETERTRLSLLEDKLTDSLSLLLQLQNKDVSHRVLEKIVMDSLDVCSKPGAGTVLKADDAPCVHLSSSDLPRDKVGEQSRENHLLPPSGHQSSSVNSSISCGSIC